MSVRSNSTLDLIYLSLLLGSGLYMVGSSVTGFGDSRCDVDLCFMVSHQPLTKPKTMAILQHVNKLIMRIRKSSAIFLSPLFGIIYTILLFQ